MTTKVYRPINKQDLLADALRSPIHTFDFNSLISPGSKLTDLEICTEFRYGSLDELDRVVLCLIKEIAREQDADKVVAELASKISVFGREYTRYEAYLTGLLPRSVKEKSSFITKVSTWFDLLAESFGLSWRFAGFVHYPSAKLKNNSKKLDGLAIYSEREDKSENASAFLKRLYAEELAAGALTLSELKGVDKSLWQALRNWAKHGSHDLEQIIPRGLGQRGRRRMNLGFDPTCLDPHDPVHALALQAVDIRARGRERAKRSYQARKATP